MEIESQRQIITTEGSLPFQLSSFDDIYVLAHEHLHPQISINQQFPISLETLQYHRAHPYSVENTSVTATLFEHEISTLNINHPKQLLIIDCSLSNSKVPENLQKYRIVKGYLQQVPRAAINTSTSDKEKKEIQVFTSADFISKQLHYEFDSVSSELRSGFIGEIEIEQDLLRADSQLYRQCLQRIYSSYQQYSVEKKCPIFISMTQFRDGNSNAYTFKADNCNSELQRMVQATSYMSKLFNNPQINANILLINPRIILEQTTSKSKQQLTFVTKAHNISQLQELYDQHYNVCYEVSRYWGSQHALKVIRHLAFAYPAQTIISCGIRFKTDLMTYGGEGLKMSRSLRILFGDNKKLKEQTMKYNMLKLLAWHQKKAVVVQTRMWTCCKCSKEHPQTTQAFNKFGKKFCSIDCLRGFKF